MHKGRLEAFSDGIMAVIITIMVLEFKVPRHADIAALISLQSTFAAYILSFVFIGIYWNNHHHMFQSVSHVDGRIMWANHFLLFWISLVPFATAWMGNNHNEALPTACYAAILFFSAIGYVLLQAAIVAHHGHESLLKRAVGKDYKGKTSLILYLIAFLAAFYAPHVSDILFIVVALIWIVPDPRIEKEMPHQLHEH